MSRHFAWPDWVRPFFLKKLLCFISSAKRLGLWQFKTQKFSFHCKYYSNCYTSVLKQTWEERLQRPSWSRSSNPFLDQVIPKIPPGICHYCNDALLWNKQELQMSIQTHLHFSYSRQVVCLATMTDFLLSIDTSCSKLMPYLSTETWAQTDIFTSRYKVQSLGQFQDTASEDWTPSCKRRTKLPCWPPSVTLSQLTAFFQWNILMQYMLLKRKSESPCLPSRKLLCNFNLI